MKDILIIIFFKLEYKFLFMTFIIVALFYI
jgi:hypothetical protein